MRTVDMIWSDMATIMDGAVGRNLTDDEVTRYQALDRELETTNRSEALRQKHAAYNTTIVPAGVPSPSPRDTETIDDAFRNYLRTGRPNADISDLEVRNAQGGATGPGGGYTVPPGFRTKLVDRMKRFGGLANVVETLETPTGNSIEYPTLDDTANTGEAVDESATNTTGADLVFGHVTLGAYSYQAAGKDGSPLRVPWELTQDTEFDIEDLAASKLGQRLGRAAAPHLVNGTGVKQPKGLVHGLTGMEISSALSYGDLLDVIDLVDEDYLENAGWAFNKKSWTAIKKINDSHGDPLWRPIQLADSTQPGGLVLLGFPVTLDSAFGDIQLTDGADDVWGAFGDFREGYVRRVVRDIAVVVNPWTRASYRETEYTAWMRMDGAPQNPHAYTAIAGHTA